MWKKKFSEMQMGLLLNWCDRSAIDNFSEPIESAHCERALASIAQISKKNFKQGHYQFFLSTPRVRNQRVRRTKQCSVSLAFFLPTLFFCRSAQHSMDAPL